MTTLERLPPHSVEAEEAVLGSLLIDPDAIFDVASFLRPDAFYRVQNRWIYEAILSLSDRREPLDFITLTEELRRREQLEEVGGEGYVIGLINAVPTSINARSYGRLVEAASMRRKLIKAAGKIAEFAFDEAEDINVVIDRSEQALFSISEERTTRDLVPIKQIARSYLERIEQLHQRGDEFIGVPTGFTDLDRLLGGLNKSDLIILAARPGMGKTSLQTAMAQTASHRYGKRIAIFNLEMSGEQLVQRMIAAETRIDSQRLRRGDLHDHEWPIFMEAIGRLSETRIFIDDTPSITPNQLRTKCRRLYAEHGLDMIMIDYLQLMQAERSSNNRVMEISEISRSLKGLARELDVPVVAAAQLSRAVEQRQDKRPLLSDLRDSGCLAGDTLVTLVSTGQRVPIRDLVGKSDFKVWALNEETLKIEPAVVSRAFSTGIKPVYRLTTRLGKTIRATANHKFRTFDGWKRLDELSSGDHLALPRFLPSPTLQAISDNELALLGHLIGDGCVLPRHALQYTTREKDLAEIVASLTREIFGDEVNPRIQQERTWYQVYLSSTRSHTHGVRSAVSEWCDELGIFGLRSFEKHVPDKVFSQPRQAIALFLRHLWSTDGCVHFRTRKGRAYPEELAHLTESDIYWDRAVSIELENEVEVYDLTVPGHHNFVANDVIVHNSIEQDADIVMFIYRDEYYNPDTTERPNIAELNIAKHRNGPTGTIDLYWHGKLATFRNLQRQEINL